MTMPPLSAGKLRKLQTLADAEGRFHMLAIDQRGSVASSLAKRRGVDVKNLPFEALAQTKEVITRTLAPLTSGLLTDPIYGYPYSVQHIPGDVGVLMACEESGYELAETGENERLSGLIPDWSVAKAAHAGADAIKFLLYYHPDTGEATRRHQQDLMRNLGRECAEHGLPFVLEIVTYSLVNAAKTLEFAREKPDLVIRSAEEFSKPEYGVDLLKLEFPCDLKFTAEYAHGLFDGKYREAAYSLEKVRAYCRQLDAACSMPWVILSAGVEIEEFIENIRLTAEAGASGYLCGRAVWKGALDLYPDLEAMEEHCRTVARYNWVRCAATAQIALPWFEHRRFGGRENARIEGLSPDWYRNQPG